MPTELTGALRFAFLACAVKGKYCLVANCLRKMPEHKFLKYARTIFDSRTVHKLDAISDPYLVIPVTRFDPIWISKTPSSVT